MLEVFLVKRAVSLVILALPFYCVEIVAAASCVHVHQVHVWSIKIDAIIFISCQ